MSVHEGQLGRKTPPDFEHVAKYPIAALPPEVTPTHVPVVLGINWYTNFDRPIKGIDGKYRIGHGSLGTIRGGHCLCTEPAKQKGQTGEEQDIESWWKFYDQGEEGACEGFGHSRALSLLKRVKYDAFHLYDDARRVEGAYPDGEGSTNRSACAALVKWGDHHETGEQCVRKPETGLGDKIVAYHWATSVDQILAALGIPASVGEVPLLNSWGVNYPHRVYLADTALDRVLREEGEASVFVLA